MIKEYVRRSLPDYLIESDSYKDIGGKGFVERYLEIFGDELDLEYVTKIENLVKQKDPKLADATMLDLLASANGDLPNLSKDTAHYRNIISFISAIWRIKGTIKSYQSGFYMLELYNTVITEEVPVEVMYDDDAIEYDEEPEWEYDTDCPTCSGYSISTEGGGPLTISLYRKMLAVVTLLQPINAILRSITYNGVLIETIFIGVEVDGDGNLVYDNAADPELILSLSPTGDLIIDGPNASRYFLNDDGDLIFLL